MARGGRKKTAEPSLFKKGEPKDKKSFWSHFFEPVPEDEDEEEFFLNAFDGGPDTAGALPYDDGAPLYPAHVTQEDAARSTRRDAMRVAADAPYAAAAGSEESGVYRHESAPPVMQGASYIPLGTPYAPDNPYAPPGMSQTPGAPYVPLGTPYAPDNPYAPLGTPQTPGAPYVPLGTPYTPDNPYVPPGTPYAPDNPYAPLGTPYAPDNPYVLPGAPYAPDNTPYAPPGTPQAAGEPYMPVPPYAGDSSGYGGALPEEESEDIHLFDEVEDADNVRSSERGQTTRLFRTGTGATTRIHINETEDAIRMEEAAKRSRAREAKKRHEAAMERRNKRKKRNTILRKLFANVAFVLFFIVAVIVALYYGFLLSDIIVLGNDTYSSEYIVQLSGLELGKHMLFCDLDGAADNVRQDPYLQVEQVNYIFPSRIRIIVSERKEVAGIIGLDYNVIIDDQGYVLSMSGGTDISSLLQVTGVSTTGFQLGQQLGEGNDLGTATLVQIIEKLEQFQLMGSVKSIDMTTPLAITFTAGNGLNVHLGQAADLDNKLNTFARLYPQFVAQNIYEGTLYLSAKGGAVYSPLGAAAAAAAEAGDVQEPEDLTTDPDTTTLPEDDDQGSTSPDDGTSTPTPAELPATPTPYNPGGSSDEFHG